MKMESAQVHGLGDFHQCWAAMKMIAHEFQSGNHSSQFRISGKVPCARPRPLWAGGLKSYKHKSPRADCRIAAMRNDVENPLVAQGIGKHYTVCSHLPALVRSRRGKLGQTLMHEFSNFMAKRGVQLLESIGEQ